MKTIEEKAKAYDEALERAKALYAKGAPDSLYLEEMFPELKELEDERIRKALIENFKFFGGDRLETSKWGRDDDLLVTDILAWLEKRGERKPESITDEWIEDYWQHEKVNNPYSYNKGEEIQFDHQGFVRFCQKYYKKPAEWSEEDETEFNHVIKTLKSVAKEQRSKGYNNLISSVNWLKALKERMQSQDKWKPSDEQLTELCRVISGCSYDIEPLVEMAEQLKKLKEE